MPDLALYSEHLSYANPVPGFALGRLLQHPTLLILQLTLESDPHLTP